MSIVVDGFSLFYWFGSSQQILADNCLSIELAEINLKFFIFFLAEFFIGVVGSNIGVVQLGNINGGSWGKRRFAKFSGINSFVAVGVVSYSVVFGDGV